MIRTLMASTALISLLATGAIAQAADNTANSNQAVQTDTQVQADNQTKTDNMAADAGAAVDAKMFHSAAKDDHLASKLIGTAIYESAAEDAKKIGDINDLVLGQDGQTDAVIVGVGGFLGIGEKDVAINFDQLKWQTGPNGEDWLVAGLSRDQLKNAPEFDYASIEPKNNNIETNGVAMNSGNGAADGNAMATDNNQMAASDNAANADNNAMATDNNMASNNNATTAKTNNDQMAASDNADNNAAVKDDNDQMAASDNADTKGVVKTDNDQAASDNNAVVKDDNNMASNDNATTAKTDRTQTAAINRDSLSNVPNDQISADNLMGTTVYGANDDNIGEVDDVVLTADGKVDAIVVNVGGFLGIGEKSVAVGLDNLQFMKDDNGDWYLYTNFTEDQLKSQKEYNPDSYAQNRDQQRMIYTK